MPKVQKGIIAVLAVLSGLLLVAFFLVYFSSGAGEPVELTTTQGGVRNGAAQLPLTAIAGNAPDPTEMTDGSNEQTQLRVYIAGAVRRPGVYPMREGDRLVDVMEAAGGSSDEADLEQVNLAVRVEDEGYYFIPVKAADARFSSGESGEPGGEPQQQLPSLAADPSTGELPRPVGDAAGDTPNDSDLINLNTATQTELESLPGIGPARAKAIITYRDQNGWFKTIEEITAVSGIGQGILNNLQGLIIVGESP